MHPSISDKMFLVHAGFRLVHELREPSVGGERLDVPALSFRIEGIERERGLAGAGDSRYDDELVPGDRDADIFKVVLVGHH